MSLSATLGHAILIEETGRSGTGRLVDIMSSAIPSSPGGANRKLVFVHTPLPFPASQIRLLELHPSASQFPGVEPHSAAPDGFARPIHCSIRSASIDSPPPYQALSYCWGENNLSRSVHIDGAELGITESLDSALRHLRQEREPVVIWIDQICINQNDNSEKSEQVKMMARIYSKAKQVVIWLGPASPGSDDAMHLYAQVGDAISKADLQQYCKRDTIHVLHAAVQAKDPGDELWQRVSAVQALARELLLRRLQAMADWDRHRWFGRVWVVQEFCFGAEPLFVCGHKRIPADYVKATRMLLGLDMTREFISAVRALGDDQLPLLVAVGTEDPTPAFFSTRGWRQMYDDGRGPGDTLFELLRKVYVGRGASATMPVDRVFSLVGMATDVDRLGVDIDYDRTPAQVLTDLAKALINQGNLGVLAYVQSPRDVAGLPSWVPDWRPNLRPSFYSYPAAGREHEHYFRPSGDRLPVVVPGPTDNILGLGGLVVDTVEAVGSVWTDDSGAADPLRHQNCLAEIRSLCRLSVMKNQPIYASRQRHEEAEWRVPISDCWETNESGSAAQQRATDRARRAFVDFHSLLAWLQSGSQARSTEAPDDREPAMYRLSMAKMSGMRPFMTIQGYVGMGPSALRPGDVSVLLYGARVCSVLRPGGAWAGTVGQYVYEYIGEAYCDGVMDGELLDRRREETFYIG